MYEIVKPDASGIAFLGSSVIEIPLCLLDGRTTYSPDIVNAQKIMADALHEPTLRSRLLCVEGSLMSDQFLVLRKLWTAEKPPSSMVLCVVPRDFYDTRFETRGQTAVFRSLSGLGQMNEWMRYLEGYLEYSEALIDKTIWLYRFRSVVSIETVKQLYAYLGQILPAKLSKTAATSEMSQNDFSRKTDQVLMEKSLKEYEGVYRNIDKTGDFDQQMRFLDDTLAYAHDHKVPLLLINLPLTEANKGLLPPGFYEKYRRSVTDAAAKNRVKFLDLSQPGMFKVDDFWDSGHLGLSGAKKLMNYLIPPMHSLVQLNKMTDAGEKDNEH